MRRTRTRRGWYRPAGERTNRLLDLFQEKLEKLGAQFRQEAEEWVKGQGLELTCRRGCHYCCRCAFVCSLPEGMLIARYLLAYHQDLMSELTDKMFVHQSMQERLGPDGWWAEQENCALLTEAGECLVYPVRPINCRVHLAITEPELCLKGGGKILDPDKAMEARDKLAIAFTKAMTDEEKMLAAVLPCTIGKGLAALLTGQIDRETALSDEEAVSFRKRWTQGD